MTTTPANVLASVDLGSNSFRLQICENNNGQLKVIDSFKQMVRFAAGLDEQKNLSEASQEQALECLAKFGERLRGFQPENVRVVATNTFRVAKNIAQFLPRAEAALGFPIEVIAGREEARLIYTGVVHTLPPKGDKMLVIDIGGGSTEFVIGSDLQPLTTESLPLGCVTYSMRFFQNKVTAKDFQAAVSAARIEIQRISKLMKRTGWDFAIGTSGSAKSIRDVLAAELPQEADITAQGMRYLADRIIEAGSVKKAKFENLKPERIEVFAGGLAVMIAAFEELSLTKMTVTEAALRDGVFYDLIGRSLNVDMREQTTAEFQKRYHVSLNQAKRVADTAQAFMNSLCHAKNVTVQELARGTNTSAAQAVCMKSAWILPIPVITNTPPTFSKTPICRASHAKSKPFWRNWLSAIAATSRKWRTLSATTKSCGVPYCPCAWQPSSAARACRLICRRKPSFASMKTTTASSCASTPNGWSNTPSSPMRWTTKARNGKKSICLSRFKHNKPRSVIIGSCSKSKPQAV